MMGYDLQARRKLAALERLKEAAECGDPEVAHGWADDVLIDYINDPAIKAAYNAVPKWYA